MVYLDFNELSNIEFPQVFLCHRNTKLKNGVKTIQKYGELNPIVDLNIKLYLNSPDEIHFTIPRYVNGIENPLWDDITDLKIVQIPKFGNFEIAVVRFDDGTVEQKIISGKSLEIELGQIYLNDFEINTLDQIGADEKWVPIQFYNPTDPAHSLLHLATMKVPAWSIGHVDAELWKVQRTYEVDSTAIYDFLTSDVAGQMECIFIFDTFNRVINCYSLATYGDETSIYISKENLMSELNIEADKDQIKNCFKVVGGDYVNISNVNPNGTDYLWMLTEHDKKDMSRELTERLSEYDKIYDTSKKYYEEIMSKIKIGYDTVSDLVNKVSELITPEDDLTTCGLVQLNSIRDKYQSIEDLYITVGFGEKTSNQYNERYLPNHNLIEATKAEIEVRTKQIEDEYSKIEEDVNERNRIQEQLDLEKFLTKENGDASLWLELSMYRREDIYENANYSGTDDSTDEELFELERALYEDASKELLSASTPKYNFQIGMNNILANEYFRDNGVDKFKLGNFIRVGIDDNEIAKVRLIDIELDFNNIENIVVAFSETINKGGLYSDAQSILNQASSAATSYQTVKKQYDSAKNKIDFVTQMKKEGLNTALVAIMNSGSQTTVFDEHGILCRQWNEQKQDYEPEQLKIINNLIAYTDDNWKSVRQAIGKILFNGEYVYGVIADALVGNIIAGNNLIITNQNNSFIVDETGATLIDANFTVQKGDITVVISPDTGIEITNHGDKVFYIDENGNLVTKGYIKAEDLEDPDSGTIINGSLIKSGVIMSNNYLDEDGNETGLGTLINLSTGYTTFKGKYEYAWLNKPRKTHNAQIKLETGRIKIEDLTSDEELYFSHEGISTTVDANDSSGVIDFRSEIYGSSLSSSTYNGLTMQTLGSPVALRSLSNQVIIQPNVRQGVNNYDEVVDPDDYTSDMFTFSHRNKYALDDNGNPIYENPTGDGDGLIYYGARTRNGTGGWNQSSCLRMSADQDNPYTMSAAGDNRTLAPHYSSNMFKPVKKIVATKDADGRIVSMDVTLGCYGIVKDEKVKVDVSYDADGNITAIGDTIIEY